MERNVELFHDIAEMIEAYPEKHDQSTFCGTSCCIGGWAMLLSGEYELATHSQCPPDQNWKVFRNIKTGNIHNRSDVIVMANLLGLNFSDAEVIYSKMSPPVNCSWPEALYKIAAGADVREVLYG